MYPDECLDGEVADSARARDPGDSAGLPVRRKRRRRVVGVEPPVEDPEKTGGGRRRRRRRRVGRASDGESSQTIPEGPGEDAQASDEEFGEGRDEVEEVVEAAPPAEKILLVSAVDAEEVRIALLEDGRVEEIYIEAAEERSATGNVYRGRVQNVEKAIGAAFVDLGKGVTGFLHVSDVADRSEGATIADLLEPGQDVLVQITRDRIGRKGPALTGRIALAGRYLVLLANTPRSGISRRIARGRTRNQARDLLARLEVPEGMGLIVRTAGEDVGRADLERDLHHLLAEWERATKSAAGKGPPGLLRVESDPAERSVRDIMPADVSRIVVDQEDVAVRIRTLLGTWYGPDPEGGDGVEGEGVRGDESSSPAARSIPEVVVHDDPMPLFHAHGVEQQLEEAFRRTLRLPSGGSVVIDPTEALVSIDVNSGRSTSEEDPEATILETNLEAVAVIARQLRLRDLGGLVVVDLIDMRDRRSRRKVEKTFREVLARDRARIRMGRIGPFGCIILSRQRIRQALTQVTHEECPACGGTGRRRHAAGLGLRVLREMQARVARTRGRGGLEIRVPKAIHDWLRRYRGRALRGVERSCTGPLRLEVDERLAGDGWAMKGLPPSGSPRHDSSRR